MIKFFRKIRRTLLKNGNIRQYLTYAAGEILLVMIGILLALQVNNWNEGEKQRMEEMNVLSRMIAELDRNADRLNSFYGNKSIENLTTQITFFDSVTVLMADGVNTNEIDFICSRVLFRWSTFNLASDIFEEMKNRGLFYSLKSEKLVNDIQAYYRLIEKRSEYNYIARDAADEALDYIRYGFQRLKRDYKKQGIECLKYHSWIFDSQSREFYDFESSLSTLIFHTNNTLEGVLEILEVTEQLKQAITSNIQT